MASSRGETRRYAVIFSVLFMTLGRQRLLSFHQILHGIPERAGDDPMSVYVPGAGFSGFWFTLGRLQSLTNLRERNYHCFSAGCLGVTAALTNITFEDVTDIAFGIQDEYKKGQLSRHELATSFVDRLIPSDMELTSDVLDRINVYTTTRGMVSHTRKANTTDELREMLVQTTWIPFLTGRGWWKTDDSGSHMDGGFTMIFHPHCRCKLSLPFMLDLMLNFGNPNLGRDSVARFFKAGTTYRSGT